VNLRVFYGGTFDPVHNGHLAIARAARDALDCTVRFMPAADPPHRAPPGADAGQRAAMLDLALAGEKGLRVDRRELQREGRSYTVDTLHAMRGEYGRDAPIALLVGADSFVGLPTWKDWRVLFGLAHFIVAERPGIPLDGTLPPELAEAVAGRWATTSDALRDAAGGLLLRLHQPLHDESATGIRQQIATGGAWRPLLPAAVAGYIDRHGLYRDGAADPSPL
jgi:nicotinate-nucleotide adenylyltransferase